MIEAKQAVGEKENVLIEAGACSVTVLPLFGGKIASIQFQGHELLQPPLAPLAPRTTSMAFEASDASGWDECLPSVAPCTVSTSGGPAHVPDHGDLWRVAWNSAKATPSALTLQGECFSLPLTLERKLSLAQIAGGTRISASYLLTNTGSTPVPWSWAAHPLFTAAPGDRILLPESIASLRIEGSGGRRLGVAGDWVNWPKAKLAAGGFTDLSVAQASESRIGDKLFAGPLGVDENWCALERPSVGVRIRMRFDPVEMPYLGLWICYGGWPEHDGPRQTCVALEPATAPVDSLAIAGPWSRTLAPHASASWRIHVDLEKL